MLLLERYNKYDTYLSAFFVAVTVFAFHELLDQISKIRCRPLLEKHSL